MTKTTGMELTEQEVFIILQHRDMVAHRRHGEVVHKYEAGRFIVTKKTETLKPPGGKPC